MAAAQAVRYRVQEERNVIQLNELNCALVADRVAGRIISLLRPVSLKSKKESGAEFDARIIGVLAGHAVYQSAQQKIKERHTRRRLVRILTLNHFDLAHSSLF